MYINCLQFFVTSPTFYLYLQNLIDLAGSESSKAETTGIRRKEGSYINKSLLTLGTVRPLIHHLLNKSFSILLPLICTRSFSPLIMLETNMVKGDKNLPVPIGYDGKD